MKSSFFSRLSGDRHGKSISALFALLLCTPALSTATITDYNDLDHWLDGAPKGGSADWTAKDGFQYMIDDNGHGPTGYVSPGWGGQEYDAEAIYINKTANLLEIAVVTGMHPTAAHTYGPGDIAIDLNYQMNGSASFDIGIVTTGDNAGKIYQVDAGGWNYGLWNESGGHDPLDPDQAHPTSIKNSSVNSLLGNADAFYYGEALYDNTSLLQLGEHAGDNHYLIALSIDLNRTDLEFLTNGLEQGAFLAHWTMNCANDSVEVDPPAGVPEPASILLVFAGLLGFISFRRFHNS
ncbi:MAG: PEP-CTERM sorting domain-containing protein [Gammaproteobacteria bacterium]|nr:PEP-CTERM sorting domain-containing protein [Gammaproteobacteria bacterium]